MEAGWQLHTVGSKQWLWPLLCRTTTDTMSGHHVRFYSTTSDTISGHHVIIYSTTAGTIYCRQVILSPWYIMTFRHRFQDYSHNMARDSDSPLLWFKILDGAGPGEPLVQMKPLYEPYKAIPPLRHFYSLCWSVVNEYRNQGGLQWAGTACSWAVQKQSLQ